MFGGFAAPYQFRQGSMEDDMAPVATEVKSETMTAKYRVAGSELVTRAKTLVHEGNIRRLIVKDDKEHTILEIPLTVGVVGAMLLPVWVALGAMAALAAHYTLVVEKHEPA
jgi:hypothetical protein